ncbi:radical SAM protein [Omnitrophica bacterium]|nr:radical SAM protein [Candidatus Omnitrophota bacterium]
MKKHYTIPFFIPHKGCPFTCVFCRQDKISGRVEGASPKEIAPTIKSYLKTLPGRNVRIEVAFFGGSFTGLGKEAQRRYLEKVRPFLNNKMIHGLRLSTRPDLIDKDVLRLLKEYGVSRIELGVQSMSDAVLKKAKRGHSASNIAKASNLILEAHFDLGHQLMVGLPGSTLRDELNSAKCSIRMGASEVRIYPVIIIKGTELAEMWKEGAYKPLTEEEAIRRCARLLLLFEKHNVKVIRCGLHPSEGLLSGKDIIAGLFHQAFRQKVETYIYAALFKNFFKDKKDVKDVEAIFYNPRDAACVIGYNRINGDYVEKRLKRRAILKASLSIKPGSVKIKYKNNKTLLLKRG